MWKHFKLDEFRCPCCNDLIIDEHLVDMLDVARETAGIPFIITSGYRCVKHNESIGGKPNSAHLRGQAADIGCVDSRSRYAIVRALLEAGFMRIGIAPNFIHCDIDYSKPHPVIWVYE